MADLHLEEIVKVDLEHGKTPLWETIGGERIYHGGQTYYTYLLLLKDGKWYYSSHEERVIAHDVDGEVKESLSELQGGKRIEELKTALEPVAKRLGLNFDGLGDPLMLNVRRMVEMVAKYERTENDIDVFLRVDGSRIFLKRVKHHPSDEYDFEEFFKEARGRQVEEAR